MKKLETLRKKIEDYLKIEDDKSRIPNFKENMEKSNTISFLKELLPTITDDDYFLDKRDSLVYSYLMEDEDKEKRLKTIIQLPDNSIKTYNITKSNNTDIINETKSNEIIENDKELIEQKEIQYNKSISNSSNINSNNSITQLESISDSKIENDSINQKNDIKTLTSEKINEKEEKVDNKITNIDKCSPFSDKNFTNSSERNDLKKFINEMLEDLFNGNKPNMNLINRLDDSPIKPTITTQLYNNTKKIELENNYTLCNSDNNSINVTNQEIQNIANLTLLSNITQNNTNKEYETGPASLFSMNLEEENDTIVNTTKIKKKVIQTIDETQYNEKPEVKIENVISIIPVANLNNIVNQDTINNECENKETNKKIITNLIRDELLETENLKSKLIELYLKRKKNLLEKKKQEIDPPIFKQKEISLAKSIKKKNVNTIKKLYEDSTTYEYPKFIQRTKTENVVWGNIKPKIVGVNKTNLRRIPPYIPHYGYIGDQYIYDEKPSYKFYNKN